jgi:hypothetical protein
MTASDVRRNWFRVLDEVLAGETIAVERHGRRVILRADDTREATAAAPAPDYSRILRGNVEEADSWSWDWPGPEDDLSPTG